MRKICLILALLIMPLFIGADTPVGETYRIYKRFFRSDSTLITSSNGQITSYSDWIADTTGTGTNWTYIPASLEWYGAFSGESPEVIDIYETGGTPDTLIYESWRLPGILVADSCITSSAFQVGAVDASAIAAGAISNANKASANLWAAASIDETDDYAWSGDNTYTGLATFSDTIKVTGLASWEEFELFKHPNASVVDDTPDRVLEFFEYDGGANAYGAYAYAVGGAQSRIMTPWMADGAVFERLWEIPARVNTDSTIYIEFHYALQNVAVGDSVDWVIELATYDLSVTGTPGEEILESLSTAAAFDPTTFTVGHDTYYDYTIVRQAEGQVQTGAVTPGSYLDLRATLDLGVDDSPICLVKVLLRASVTRTIPERLGAL